MDMAWGEEEDLVEAGEEAGEEAGDGLAWGIIPMAQGYPYPPEPRTPKEEKEMLNEDLKDLKEEMKAIEERIKELEAKKTKK